MSSLIFNSITINNFKSFQGKHKFVLKRDAGLYYIAGDNKLDPDLGPNGVGKSTLWDALIWCLFGKTGRDNRPADAVVPWKGEGQTWVRVRFYRGAGTEWTLYRSRHPNELALKTKDDHVILQTVSQEAVEKILGMSEETFRHAVVLSQFGTLFLDLKPEQQSQMFNEALGLDLWLRASDVASRERKAYESAARQAGGAVANLRGRLTELTQQHKLEQKLAEEYETSKNKKLDKLKESLKLKEKEFGKLGSCESLEDLISETRASRSSLHKLVLSLTTQVEMAAIQRRNAEKEIDAYNKALKTENKCPECGQKVPTSHLVRKLDEAKSSWAKANTAYEGASKDLKITQRKHYKLDEEITTLLNQSVQFGSLDKEVDSLNKQIKELKKEENPHLNTVKDMKFRAKKLDEQIKESEEKARELEAQAGVCDYWVSAFKEIRLNLIDQTLEELEIAVIRHAEALGLDGWNIKFLTERESKSGNVSAVFTTLLYPPGLKEPVKWESYSGGESQRWQMAVAFGLSEVLLARAGVEPNIEVLDEPTRGLSPEGVEDLLEHLAERARDLDRSIYVVEHHSLERGLFADTIMITKDQKGSHIEE